MPEREALTINLSDGYVLVAAGVRRERNGTLTCDLMLNDGRILFADRAVINEADHVRSWAERATAEDRPSAERLIEAIRELLLPDALALLQEGEARKPTQADQLVQLLTGSGDLASDVLEAGVELFHDAAGDAYATLPIGEHRETWPLQSRGFRQWLARRFYEHYDKSPTAQALADATAVLAGKALYDGPEYEVHVRVAEVDGVFYLDLGDAAWRAIAIDSHGWRLVAAPPVKFRRPRGLLPLPVPEPGGSVDALRPFVNVASDADWVLLVAWLIAALRPHGPFPVLAYHGEHGTGKSTLTRMVRSLVDPNRAPIRSISRDERDLLIAATNSWCIALDNISSLSPWISDALCRLATGGGFATRQLFTDREETILDAQRPIVVNGISEVATRGDLLDRAIILDLPTIPEEQRRPETEVWATFTAAQPMILGALLDAVSAAMRNLSTTRLERLPRMADLALWVTAAEPALGWDAGTFLRAYTANRDAANDLVLESSPVSQAVRTLVTERQRWTGTATDLLQTLNDLVDDQTKRQKAWPASGRTLASALRRLAPNLRASGIRVEFRREGRSRRRTIHLESAGDAASAPSASSAAPKNSSDDGLMGAAEADARADATDANVGDADAHRNPVASAEHFALAGNADNADAADARMQNQSFWDGSPDAEGADDAFEEGIL